MKIQTSLEFLLITSAISMLMLAAIASYSHAFNASSLAARNNTHAGNYSFSSAASSPADNPNLIIHIPGNSSLMQSNPISVAFYGCGSGHGSVSFSSSSAVFSQEYISNVAISQFGFAQDSYIPLFQGISAINATYAISCGNATSFGKISMETYSSQSNYSIQGGSAYAIISSRNESIAYPISGISRVSQLSTWSHCTYADMWGPAPMRSQCGTVNGWEYFVSSPSCYYDGGYLTEVYCVVPSSGQYYLKQAIPQSKRYIYNFTLSINSQIGEMHSMLNSGETSNVMLNGVAVGHAEAGEASGDAISSIVYILYNGSKAMPINSSSASPFQNTMQSTYGLLKYYNGSEVSASTRSSIQQSIAFFNQQAQSIISSPSLSLQTTCSISNQTLTCKPMLPLSYYINAVLGIQFQNTTLQYMGSIISIAGKG